MGENQELTVAIYGRKKRLTIHMLISYKNQSDSSREAGSKGGIASCRLGLATIRGREKERKSPMPEVFALAACDL